MITIDAVLSKFSPQGIDVLSVPRRVLEWKIKLKDRHRKGCLRWSNELNINTVPRTKRKLVEN